MIPKVFQTRKNNFEKDKAIGMNAYDTLSGAINGMRERGFISLL